MHGAHISPGPWLALLAALPGLTTSGCQIDRTVGEVAATDGDDAETGPEQCADCRASLRVVDLAELRANLEAAIELETGLPAGLSGETAIRDLAQLGNGQVVAVGVALESATGDDDDWGLIAHFTPDATLVSSQLLDVALTSVDADGDVAVTAGWDDDRLLRGWYAVGDAWTTQLRPDLGRYEDVAMAGDGGTWLAGISYVDDPGVHLAYADAGGEATPLKLPDAGPAWGPIMASAVVPLPDGGALFVGSGDSPGTGNQQPWVGVFGPDKQLRWQEFLDGDHGPAGFFWDVALMPNGEAVAVGVTDTSPGLGSPIGVLARIDPSSRIRGGTDVDTATGFTAAGTDAAGHLFAINHIRADADGNDLVLHERWSDNDGSTRRRDHRLDADGVHVYALLPLAGGGVALGGYRTTQQGAEPWLGLVSFGE